MNKILFSLVKLIYGANSDYIRAIEYNDRFANYQDKTTKKWKVFCNSFLKANPADMNLKLKEYKLQVDESLAELSQMADFKGNFRLRDSVIARFKFFQSIADNESREIIDILSLGNENISDTERNHLSEIFRKMTADELEIAKKIEEAQREFAKKNDINY